MNKLTYISLFSCAGVGCYGFKAEDFECVATNEYLGKRLAIQKYNKKCKYDTGYIEGDIESAEVQSKIDIEVQRWKDNEGMDDLTLLVATPPCQGMSIANYFKKEKDIERNSLVVTAIEQVLKYKPRYFVFENVPAFLKTACVDKDGNVKAIGDLITEKLGKIYEIERGVMDFGNYGANSSRKRTLVTGVRKDIYKGKGIMPENVGSKTMREIIGHLPSLKVMGEIDSTDIYHNYRTMPENVLKWVKATPEGCSALDNANPEDRPHRIVDGKYSPYSATVKSKYRRNIWDRVAYCILTRSDIASSQNTLHPSDDRVLSIRELMLLMSIPTTFKWTEQSEKELNTLTFEGKKAYLKKNEMNIRQCIGEAVPTGVFMNIARQIKHNEEIKYDSRGNV